MWGEHATGARRGDEDGQSSPWEVTSVACAETRRGPRKPTTFANYAQTSRGRGGRAARARGPSVSARTHVAGDAIRDARPASRQTPHRAAAPSAWRTNARNAAACVYPGARKNACRPTSEWCSCRPRAKSPHDAGRVYGGPRCRPPRTRHSIEVSRDKATDE